MPQRIIIDPVTRIEGHAKITIHLDQDGQVSEARFHVAEFRGFEKFCVGRPFTEMPGITARICGICPISHLLASAKAGDGLLAVTIPPAALKLRRLMNLAQFVQSHALSFFHLSAPDLLLGFDSDPAKRNVFGLLGVAPELVRGGIRLRQFGQQIIEFLGGKKIHPAWAVPGGVREPLQDEDREKIRQRMPEAFTAAKLALDLCQQMHDHYAAEVASFGNFPSLFLGLVGPHGLWEHHDGLLRFMDSEGSMVADGLDPAHYREYLGEAVQSDSYLKSPYYKPLGYPAGIYRVGPLARLNVCTRIGTPQADACLQEFRQRGGGTVNGSFFYHYARLVEIIAALERIALLLDNPELSEPPFRAQAGLNRREAVGCSEAPRGTLFHHYHVDDHGLLTKVNFIIATGQNNLAMNRTVTQIAQRFIRGPEIPEGMLNRVEAGIRAFDPCLSCSTHAVGQMPLVVQLIDAQGNLVAHAKR